MAVTDLNNRTIAELCRAGNVRELTALMLHEVYENGAYSNLVLKKCDKVKGFTGPLSRAVRAMLYGTVTYTCSIDFMVRHIAKRDLNELDAFPRTLIRLGCWQILFSDTPGFAAVSETVDIAGKYCPRAKGLVNAVLRRVAQASDDEKDIDKYRPDVACSLPSELYGILKRDYGKDRALSVGKAFLKTPALTIRFDPSRISAEELKKRLADESFTVTPGSFLDEVLTVATGGTSIEDSKAYQEGLFIVQNEAAALASVIASPKDGDRILDCCAAPGGKTTHLAEITHHKADILALDSSSSRLELLKDNLKRLKIDNVRTMTADSTDLSTVEGDFDLVLCDAPCSGLGIIGRKPDIRLNMTYEKISSIADVQRLILDQAASKVKRGGTLIYCTCTVNKDENERRVEEFLKSHAGFKAVSLMPFLPEHIIMDDDRRSSAMQGHITLLPDVDGCDGFFIARLERSI